MLVVGVSGLAVAEALKAPKDVALEVEMAKAVLIDVREAAELIEGGMAEPAVWLATSEIKSKSERYRAIVKSLPKDKLIYVYCASGKRSGAFADALTAEGFKASNLGGFKDWKSAALPVKALSEVKSGPCPYLCGKL